MCVAFPTVLDEIAHSITDWKIGCYVMDGMENVHSSHQQSECKHLYLVFVSVFLEKPMYTFTDII